MNSSNIYTLKVKNGAGWRAFDKARLQISVGQDYHEGEKLLATLEWVNGRFEKVIICVNDTLQRHNFEFDGHAPDQAYEQSLAAGQEWIARNQGMIDQLNDYEIIRWEEWRADPAYEHGLGVMRRLYAENSGFRKEVDDEVSGFWSRMLKREDAPDSFRFETFRRHSLSYLLEECAIFQLMFARDTAVDIYPGSTLLPCKLGPSQNLGARGYTRVDFRRKAA